MQLRCIGGLGLRGRLVEVDDVRLAAQGEAEGQAAPVLGQLRMDGVGIAGDAQAAKAKGEGLPEAAGGGGMDAVASVAAHIVDVGEGGTHEVGVSFGGVAQAAGGPGMNGRAEG